MKILIVTGGSIQDGFTLDFIKKEKYDVKIAVDKGLEFFSRNELWPDYIVGDFDSADTSVLKKYPEEKIIRLNPMKDDTDTEHALRMALSMNCASIDVIGATGTRLDHVLGNIQLLGIALKAGVECNMVDANNRIRLINKETVLKKEEQFGKYVSLIPYTPQVTGLTLEGFLYPLKDHTMSCFYMENAAPISGISNEIVSTEARIIIKSGILVLIESRD